MREHTDLTDDFKTAINNASGAPALERIERRACSSDNYDGIEYTFCGVYIPIRPILSVVAETDGVAIEHMTYNNEFEEPNLTVFVATLDEPPHSTFTRVSST